MYTFFKTKLLPRIFCLMLTVAMAFFTAGCNSSVSSSKEPASTSKETNVLGKGDTQFTFTVTDPDGNETVLEIHTDKKTVGEALTELGLIDGEDSEYGLYVKTVNGITIDPDKDGTYWAFYIDGEYAQTGVDTTDITPGSNYSFRVEKA